MFKKTTQAVAMATALFGFHAVASACTPGDPACTSNVSSDNKVSSTLNVSGNHSGIYVQLNRGIGDSSVNLYNVVIPVNGNVTARADSIGNNLSANFNGATLPLRHIVQTNGGSQRATVFMTQTDASRPNAVNLTSFAAGNNFAANTSSGASVGELSAIQCNTAAITSSVTFQRDPMSLNVNSVAYGNSINLSAVR